MTWYVARAGGMLAYLLLSSSVVAGLRRAHYLNFAVWLLALVHGLTAGTDARTMWALSLYAGSAWLVLALTVHRVTVRWGQPAAGTS